MCKTAVEIDASAHLARIAVGDIDKSSLIIRIARTEDNDLHTVVEHFLKHIEQEIKALRNALYKERREASDERAKYEHELKALRMEHRELADLNFADAALSVSIEDAPAGEKGSDRVEFLIRTNKGEAFKPLAKIASGGELSRIMLAMKRIIGDLDRIPTMIFDEIDAGISGATAGVVGEKLRSISADHQIVCITHLPQIAALGDHHYRIEKISDEISAHTTVVPLSQEERIEELARLLSGTTVTDSARQQARELLKR